MKARLGKVEVYGSRTIVWLQVEAKTLENQEWQAVLELDHNARCQGLGGTYVLPFAVALQLFPQFSKAGLKYRSAKIIQEE